MIVVVTSPLPLFIDVTILDVNGNATCALLQV